LPLDCTDPTQCTREDVLSYYARVINHGELRIYFRTECVALRPQDGAVLVVLRTPTGLSTLQARRVLITNWFRPRRFPRSSPADADGVQVMHGVQLPAAVAGRTVVVFGGGLSGVEQASLLMCAGQRVVLLLRQAPGVIHKDRTFEQLLRCTGSRILDRVEDVRLSRGSVFCTRDGQRECMVADTLIFAGGARVDERTVMLLRRGGLVSNSLAHALLAVATADGRAPVLRTVPTTDETSRPSPVPDLWRFLFSGCRGVHFAGSILHHGTYRAGIAVSIASTRLAIAAVAGDPVPSGWRPPLPDMLRQPEFFEYCKAVSNWRPFDAIRPRPVAGWSRHWPLPKSTQTPRSPVEYVVGERSPIDEALLACSDGRETIRELSLRTGLVERWDRAELRSAFRDLFYRNALTWVPNPRNCWTQEDSAKRGQSLL
jgi:hypothetical protein